MNRRLCSENTWAMRFKTIMVALGHAVRLGTFPTGQSVYYGHLRDSVFGWPLNQLLWIFAAVAVCAAISDRIGCRRTLFGVGWFLLTFFPVSNIIPTGVLVAERTLYLPVLGICFLAAVVLDRITLTDSSVRLVARGGLVAIVLLSAAQGARVVGHWRNEESLWRSTVLAHPRVAAGSTSSWASHSSTVAADRPGSPLRRRTLRNRHGLQDRLRAKSRTAAGAHRFGNRGHAGRRPPHRRTIPARSGPTASGRS